MLAKTKKILALALTVCLLMGMLPLSVFAATVTDKNQVVSGGYVDANTPAWQYPEPEGKTHDLLKMREYIEQVKDGDGNLVENEFDVTVEVVTKSKVETVQMSPDVATVVILDVSGSMLSGGDFLTPAKTAAKDFLDGYAQGITDNLRMVSLVQFGSQAQTVMGWTDVAGSAGMGAAKAAVDSTKTKFSYRVGYGACNVMGSHDDCEVDGSRNLTTAVASTDTTNSSGTRRCAECRDRLNSGYHYHCGVSGCEILSSHRHCSKPGCTRTDNHLECDYCDRKGLSDFHYHDVHSDETHDGPHGGTAGEAGQGTNMSGALLLARNLLKQLKANPDYAHITHLYVVLLTDGEPTYAIISDEYDNDTTSFINYQLGNGSSVTDAMHKAVKDIGRDHAGTGGNIRGIPSNILSVKYRTTASMAGLDHISNKVYPASNYDQLKLVFQGFNDTIRMAAEAWKVVLPIAEPVTFTSFASGSPSGDVLKINAANNEITWSLTDADPVQIATDEYKYTLKFRVKLDTLDEDFVAGKAYQATTQTNPLVGTPVVLNGSRLTYIINKNALGGVIDPDSGAVGKVANFEVPTVKGFCDSFSFQKVKYHKNDEGLGGVTFTLSADPQVTPAWTRTATSSSLSGSVGNTTFTNVPSGQSYKLIETATSSDYDLLATEYDVTVSFGRTVIKDGDTVVYDSDLETNAFKPANKLKPGSRNITVTKAWGTVDISLKGAVVIELLADGEAFSPAKTITLTGTSSPAWEGSFTGLPRVDVETGNEIKYTVREVSVGGVAVNDDNFPFLVSGPTGSMDGGFTIKNEFNSSRETSIEVEKVWIAPAGATLPSVTVSIERRTGTEAFAIFGKADITLTGPSWTESFDNLDYYDLATGLPYEYQVKETVPSGYSLVDQVVYTGTHAGGDRKATITNKINQEDTSVTITKTWIDTAETAARGQMTFVLYQDGVDINDMTVNPAAFPAKTQQITFDEDRAGDPLPKYKFNDNGTVELYVYTIVETGVPAGYTKINETAVGVTNLRAGETSVYVEKAWIDSGENRPKSVEVVLKQNGTQFGSSQTLNAGNSWNYTWPELDKYDGNGYLYSYTVDEVDAQELENYAPSIATLERTGADFNFRVTNTMIDVDELVLTINKTWLHPVGTVAPEIIFNVVQTDEDGVEVVIPVTLSSGKTTTSITVPKDYEIKDVDGEVIDFGEYTYSVKENVPDGYVLKASSVDGLTFSFKNLIKGTTEVTVNKVWVDADNAFLTRPTSITFKLWNGGTEPVDTATITAPWAEHEFSGLDKYDDQGQVINYTVTEDPVTGYTKRESSDGFTFTNTLNQSYTEIKGVKTWNAPDDEIVVITAILYQDGTEVSSVNLPVGTKDYTFTNPDRVDGKWPVYNMSSDPITKHVYTVDEEFTNADDAAKFVQSVDGYNLINTVKQQKTEYVVTKLWNAPDDVIRPNIKVTLLQNGTGIDTVTLDGTETPTAWTHTFTDLDVYDDEHERYSYTVSEEIQSMDGALDSFTGSVEGPVITNTVEQRYINYFVEKTWAGEVEFPRFPVTFTLYQDGEKIDSVVLGQPDDPETTDIDESTGWTHTFYKLPVFNYIEVDGKVVGVSRFAYTIVETAAEDQLNAFTKTSDKTTNDSGNITEKITNTAKYYEYQLICHYTTITNGVRGATNDVNIFRHKVFAAGVYTANPDSYTEYSGNKYKFVSGTPKIEGDIYGVNVNEYGTLFTIDLFYERTVTRFDGDDNYYNVTVNYYDYDTGERLAPAERTTAALEGSSYDVTDLTDRSFDGYTFVERRGDSDTGVLNSNKVINLYYSKDTVIIIPPDPTPTGGPETDPDETDDFFPDDTPLADLPATGVNSLPVDPMWTLGALAILASLGIVIGFTKKDERED